MSREFDDEEETQRENESRQTEEQKGEASADHGDRLHGVRTQIQARESGLDHLLVDKVEDGDALDGAVKKREGGQGRI